MWRVPERLKGTFTTEVLFDIGFPVQCNQMTFTLK